MERTRKIILLLFGLNLLALAVNIFLLIKFQTTVEVTHIPQTIVSLS